MLAIPAKFFNPTMLILTLKNCQDWFHYHRIPSFLTALYSETVIGGETRQKFSAMTADFRHDTRISIQETPHGNADKVKKHDCHHSGISLVNHSKAISDLKLKQRSTGEEPHAIAHEEWLGPDRHRGTKTNITYSRWMKYK